MSSYLDGLLQQATAIYDAAKKYNTTAAAIKKPQPQQTTNSSSVYASSRRRTGSGFINNGSSNQQQALKKFSIADIMIKARKGLANANTNAKDAATVNNKRQGNVIIQKNIDNNKNSKQLLINNNLVKRTTEWSNALAAMKTAMQKYYPRQDSTAQIDKWIEKNPKPSATDEGYATGKFKASTSIPIYVPVLLKKRVKEKYFSGVGKKGRWRTKTVIKDFWTTKSFDSNNLAKFSANNEFLNSGRYKNILDMDSHNQKLFEMMDANNKVHGVNNENYTDEQLANVNWTGVEKLQEQYQGLADSRDRYYAMTDADLKKPINKTKLTSILTSMLDLNKSISVESNIALKQAGFTTQNKGNLEDIQISKLRDIDTQLQIQDEKNRSAVALSKAKAAVTVSSVKDVIAARATSIQGEKKKKKFAGFSSDDTDLDQRPI